MHKVGIVGCGFVGSAVAAGFSLHADVKIYDKFKAGFDSWAEVIKQDIIFLCLPTPMHKDGHAVLDYIYEVGRMLWSDTEEEKIVVIKSTVPPGTTRAMQESFPKRLHWVMNPEFLTARSARLDFINASRIVIGGEGPMSVGVVQLAQLYRERFPATAIYQTVWEAAELVKYMNNCFFALKISYLNEIYRVCAKLGLPYNDLKAMFMSDGRIGNSHLDVPGFDGDFGYGGTCFPKDMAAFTVWARENGVAMHTLEAARAVNSVVRNKQDWEVVG